MADDALSSYFDTFSEAETAFGLPHNLLRAIATQENVDPRHNNPLGLSTDAGVKTFATPADARNAIFSQAKLMTDPNGPYKKWVQTGNINDLAAVYSPVGAKNDIYGTNVTEAAGITTSLRQLNQERQKEDVSPLAQLKAKYPQYSGISDDKLIDSLYGSRDAFKRIPKDQFAQYMRSPTGGADLKIKLSSTETPIQKFRDKYPQYSTFTDDQIAQKLYPIAKAKDPTLTLEGFKDRLSPKSGNNNWAINLGKTVGSVALEAVKQIPAQSVDVAGSAWRGLSEISQKGAQDEVNKLLPALGQGLSLDDWLKLTPDQREAKLFAGTSLLGDKKADPRSQDFLIALGQLDKQGQVQKANAWMERVVGQVDQDNKGSLPEAQERAAKTIAQAPAALLLNLFPGLRELSNYGLLYDQNRKYLESKNPSLGADKINDLAMKMADQQFPAQEVLSLIMARGGGALTAGITNKILKAGAEVGVASGTGAGVFTSNQLIRNIGSGDDWTKDLGESAFEGSLLGGVGAGTRLTLNGIKNLLRTSRDGKAISGTLNSTLSMTPEESNDFVAGGNNNPVSRKLDAAALGLGLDAIQDFVTPAEAEEGDVLGTYTFPKQTIVPPLGFKNPVIKPETGEILSRGQDPEAMKAYLRSNPQPWVEPIIQAQEAHSNGDTDTAGRKFDEALSLMPDAARQKVADTVKASVQAAAQKHTEPPKKTSVAWQELKPWETEADIPQGAETKTDQSGKIFWKAPEKTETVEPQLNGYYGLDNAPKETIPVKAEKPQSTGDKIYQAYQKVKSKTGRDYVYIHEVAKESGIPQSELNRFILGEGSVDLAEGDWGTVPKEVNEAAPTLMGRKRLLMDMSRYQPPKIDIKPGFGSLGLMPESPFVQMRRGLMAVHQSEAMRKWNRIFAPERLGEQAEGTAAIGKGVKAKESAAATMAVRVLADEAELNKIQKNYTDTDRRETFWHKYSNQELADMISKRESGEKIGDKTSDKFFDFYKQVTDYFGKKALANGIKMGWLENYYRHSFKDPEKADQFFSSKGKMWAKPGWTKTREHLTINDAIANGHVPKTYNPERNTMGYVYGVTMAIDEVQQLKRMAETGLAYDTAKKVPEIAEKWTEVSTPDGKTYKVHPDSASVLKNMYNYSSIYDTVWGYPVAAASALKGVSGIKLAWSAFHPLHVIGVDIAQSFANTLYRAKRGVLTGKDMWDLMASPTRAATVPFQYNRLIRILSGRGSKEEMLNLTDQEKRDMRDFGEMGLTIQPSHERQMAWTNWIGQRVGKVGPLSKTLELGYKALISEPWQKLMFRDMIPALKFSQAMAKRDTLLRTKPDLYDPSKTLERAREFQKIGRDVDARFGEMNYDSLLWNKMAKQVGAAVPLSLSWSLGFWRIYGDAVTDLTTNVAHMDEIAKGIGKQKEFVTERMLYAAAYSTLSMAACGLLTYAMTGAIQDWKDFFYPRIGKKPNGDDERVRTPFFTTEWMSMYGHFEEESRKGGGFEHGLVGGASAYLGNKLNPGLQSLYEFWNNKDFRGREIFDPNDPVWTQWGDKAAFVIQNMGLPISAETLIPSLMGQGPQQTPEGVVASFVGFSGAPARIGRTGLENEILDEYVHEFARESGKTKKVGEIADAKKEYEYSLQTGQGVAEAQTKLKSLGVSDRVIRDSQRDYKTPIANRLFKGLNEDFQKNFMRRISPAERAEFLPYASKKVQAWWRTQGE